MQRAVFAGRRLIRHILQIVRQDDRRDLALGDRHAYSTVDEMAHLRRRRSPASTKAPATSLNIETQIEFLLVVAAERGAGLLPGDREHRHVIHSRVVKAGDQMRGAGPRRRDADPELAGKFRVSRRHECGHFFMPHLHELDGLGRVAGF